MKQAILAILLASCLALAACSQHHENNTERGTRDKILYVGNGAEPETLDPALSTGIPESHIQHALFEGLTTKNNKTLAIEPGVAESWQISQDGLTYIFRLRENARWSNGDALTAKDVFDSWQRILSPQLGSKYAYMLHVIKNAQQFNHGEISDFSQVGVEVINPYELKVILANPTPYFLQMLDHHSFFPVHKASIEKVGDFLDPMNPWTKPQHIVSNGPFSLKSWEISRQVEVEKNPYFWDKDAIKLNGIVYFPIEERSVEERAFRSGQIHLTHASSISPEKLEHYQENNPAVLRIGPAYSTYYFSINTTRKPFDDVRVRKALAMAIDREAIVNSVLKGGEIPAYSLIAPDPHGFIPQTFFSYNIEQARSLLAEAGYPNGKGFPAFSLLYNTSEMHKQIALAVEQMWKQNLNIATELSNQEWKVYLSSRRTLDYDIARAGWVADYLDPANFFDLMLSYVGNNHSGWKNPQYDQLIKAAQSAVTQQQRFDLLQQANKLLADEMPVIPIYYYANTDLVSQEVVGWHNNVMNYNNYRHVDLLSEAK